MDFLPVLQMLSGFLILLTSVCYFYQIVYLVLPLLPFRRGHKRQSPPGTPFLSLPGMRKR